MSGTSNAMLSAENLELAAQLTRIQRQFVINYVRGDMTQREAYLAASGKQLAGRTADANAARLLTYAKVRAFYDALNEQVLQQAAADSIMTREEALTTLTELARGNAGEDQKLEVRDRLAAIKQVCAMQGWEAPQKHEGELTLTSIERHIVDSAQD